MLASISLFLFAAGCVASTNDPTRPAAPATRASIAFVEKPGDVRAWDFNVVGLPATDPQTGAMVVADISKGHIVSSLSLTLRWLTPQQQTQTQTQTLTVLADQDASRVLYEVESEDEAAETAKLARRVRERTREANEVLSKLALQPTVACRVQSAEGTPSALCVHPQRVTCGSELAGAELEGDTLKTSTGTTKMGWTHAPMQIGEGPPKEMVTCILEAHYDPTTKHLAARIEQSCKGGGSDACYLPEEWRVIATR